MTAPAPAPRVTIARPSRSNGVLSIPASATQKKSGADPEGFASKPASMRLKIIIRRLPPGLTQAEFEDALGDDWKISKGKVDWAVYKEGKVSKDPAKPSRPSRAYLHLTKQDHLSLLSEHVRNTNFNDAKASSKDTVLLGPPVVEFAPYGRVPSSRPRKDARQGTIDQDPEFMDFLQSLTNPPVKTVPTNQESGSAVKAKDNVTTTPLVQFLKDKKANKGKENNTAPKGSKHSRQDSKESKPVAIAEPKSASGNVPVSPKKRSAQAVKVEQAARDAVKVLNKQVASTKQGNIASSSSKAVPVPTTPAVTPNSTANAALAEKKRERGNVSAAARILQRDLGLGGHVGGRGERRSLLGNAANRATTGKASPAAKTLETSQATQPAAPATGKSTTTTTPATDVSTAPPPIRNVPPSGPAASRASSKASAPTRAPPSGTAPALSKPAAPPSTVTQAFLKHANPSQGITEPLLEEAFAVFGKINKVEIDKKKGFAYVDFAESESLQKAIKASPIKVAQGQVVVLERKTGPTLQARNTRGGGAMMAANRGGATPVGNRGGGTPASNRGGSGRGRGGYGRGGSNFTNANNAKPTNATASTASTATSAAPVPAPTPTSAPTPSAAPASNPSAASGTQTAIESAPSHQAAQSSEAVSAS